MVRNALFSEEAGFFGNDFFLCCSSMDRESCSVQDGAEMEGLAPALEQREQLDASQDDFLG